MQITASELRRLGDDLDRGLSLPAAWYYDPAISALEREPFFRPFGQYVGRGEKVAGVGDFFPAPVGDGRVIVVHPGAGVQPLVNFSPPRRHLVASDEGRRTV